MLSVPTIASRTTALLDASATLTHCRSREQVLASIHSTLGTVAGGEAYDLLWNDTLGVRSLLRPEVRLPAPDAPALVQMEGGQVVVDKNATFVPLLLRAELRGWIAIANVVPVDAALTAWAGQCAATLVAVDQTPVDRSLDRERAALDEIAHVLSSTLDLDLLLGRMAALIEGLVDAQGFYIALTEDESPHLSFAYLKHPEGRPAPNVHWSVDEGLTGLVVRTGRPICTDDYVAECRRQGILPQDLAGLNFSHAWLGVPLRHQDRTFGVIVVTHGAPDVRYSQQDVQLLSTVAAQAAAAVANAQLYARTQRQAGQLALVNRIGRSIVSTLDPREVPMLLVRELREALDVEVALVLTEIGDGGGLEVRYAEPELGLTGVRLPPGAGLAHAALTHGHVLIEHDTIGGVASYARTHLPDQAPAHSLLCAPVQGRRARAVIELQNKRSGRFTRADVELLEAVAEQAAIALDNALLYGRTDEALAGHIRDLEERNRQLAEVVETGNNLRSTLSLEQLASLLIETIEGMSGAPRVLLGLLDQDRDHLRIAAVAGVERSSFVEEHGGWIGAEQLRTWIDGSQPIGTFSYHLGRHALLPNFRDAVIIPIRHAPDRLIGAIVFDQPLGRFPLSAEHLRTLEIVANQAAIAFHSAALYREQELTVDRLTALNGLSLAVSTSQLSTDEVARMAVAGAVGTTGGEWGGAAIMLEGRPAVFYGNGMAGEMDPALVRLLVDSESDFREWCGPQIPPSIARAGIQCLLTVSLRGAKMRIGTLWIGYSATTVTAAQREMAVLYAKVAGGVIENLYLAAAVRTAHDRMASVLASTREGMLLVGEDYRVAMVNRAFGRLLDLDEQALHGQVIDELCSSQSALALPIGPHPSLCEAVREVIAGMRDGAEGEVRVEGAEERSLTWHVLQVAAVAGERGSNGALVVMRDVTAERHTERLRQDLANMIVHDLRSPLTNMMVSVDLLLKRTTGPLTESQGRILHIASSSCQQMLDLVNALLDMRRLEQRSVELQRQPVELADILDLVIERLERSAADRQIELLVQAEGLPAVEADPEMLRRILQNLVDNAVKFSPSRGQVEITGYPASAPQLPEGHPGGEWVVVEVNDRGPGVPREYRQVIFELFGQAPHGQGQGTGLGLAFCKMAVQAHGGVIWVETNGEQGASFRFTLPVSRPVRR